MIVGPNGTIFGKVRNLNELERGDQASEKCQNDQMCSATGHLLLVCEDCDKLIKEKPERYSKDHLHDIKTAHETQHARPSCPADAGIAVQLLNHTKIIGEVRFFVADPDGVVTEDVSNAVLEPTTPPAAPRQSTIGDDQLACAYIAYLMRRYNEFAAKEKYGSNKFNPKTISQNLETRYKSRWKLIPRVRFPHVCRYLKHRIDSTGVARGNRRKGLQSYRGYGDFLLKSPEK